MGGADVERDIAGQNPVHRRDPEKGGGDCRQKRRRALEPVPALDPRVAASMRRMPRSARQLPQVACAAARTPRVSPNA
jgi:hypothetical protein